MNDRLGEHHEDYAQEHKKGIDQELHHQQILGHLRRQERREQVIEQRTSPFLSGTMVIRA